MNRRSSNHDPVTVVCGSFVRPLLTRRRRRFVLAQAAKDANLFVLWRIGPYVCAEWPKGGIPEWIYDVPGMKVRSNNQPWLDATQKWMTDHVAEIEPFLPRHGGNIILSQIENEYSGSASDPDDLA